MKKDEQTIIINESTQTTLEKNIVEHFAKGYRAVSEVTKAENGKFQIELIKNHE